MGQQAEKRQSNRTRQKNKRGDSTAKSNDSPEIPDTEETPDIPGLPLGFGNDNFILVITVNHKGHNNKRTKHNLAQKE